MDHVRAVACNSGRTNVALAGGFGLVRPSVQSFTQSRQWTKVETFAPVDVETFLL